jgi:hypothetical protein
MVKVKRNRNEEAERDAQASEQSAYNMQVAVIMNSLKADQQNMMLTMLGEDENKCVSAMQRWRIQKLYPRS